MPPVGVSGSKKMAGCPSPFRMVEVFAQHRLRIETVWIIPGSLCTWISVKNNQRVSLNGETSTTVGTHLRNETRTV